jgi:hypothetical protein
MWCPVKRDAWTQTLHEYTDKFDWSDQELENLLEPNAPGLQILIQTRYSTKTHQLVASGLQGIWTYFLKVFLEEVFLPSNALFNIMSSI